MRLGGPTLHRPLRQAGRGAGSAPARPSRPTVTARAAARTASGQDVSVSPVAVLAQAGIVVPPSAAERLLSILQPSSSTTTTTTAARIAAVLCFLEQRLGLSPRDVEVMILRCPRLLTFNVERSCEPAVEFLAGTLGLSAQQVAGTCVRFPQVLGYDAKGHLIPHCHYLRSLGLSDDDLRRLVLLRPHVLGTSIDLVIRYLHRWLRIPRASVGRLLFSYPVDYSLPRLVLPGTAKALAAAASVEEEGRGGDEEAAAAAEGGGGGGEAPAAEQRPPWGSPDRCTWLETGAGPDSEQSGGGGAAPPPSQ